MTGHTIEDRFERHERFSEVSPRDQDKTVGEPECRLLPLDGSAAELESQVSTSAQKIAFHNRE